MNYVSFDRKWLIGLGSSPESDAIWLIGSSPRSDVFWLIGSSPKSDDNDK